MQIVAIVVSFAMTLAAMAMLVPAVRRMVGVIRRGQPALDRTGNPVGRTVTMLKESFLHTRMLQWTWVGIMHWFVYAAFLFLSTAVLAAYFQLFEPSFAWPLVGHWYPYEWFSEFIGLLSSIGIVFLIIYRQKHHPRSEGRGSRFFGSNFWQAYFVEALALLEGAAILFVRAAEWKLDEDAGRSHYPIASWIGDAFYPNDPGALENAIYAIATFKIVLAMIWLMVIARNLTMGIAWHRFTVWPNIWFKREDSGRTALGAMKPLTSEGKAITLDDIDDLDEESVLGVGRLEDFSWKGILDFSTCTECGRCQSQCPAWNTEKPLSPKLLITSLRDHAYAKADGHEAHAERALVGAGTKGESGGTGTDVLDYFYNPEDAPFVIDEDVLWNCTSCGACVQQCPVDIEHVDHIMDMRRYQVLVESNFPAELNGLFKGLENKGNPWNMSSTARMDWAKGLDFEVPVVGEDLESLESVDWLFWVGCAGAYEDRAKKTTRAVAELLDMAGVSFGVLGNGETCTGDPARRAGNEFVFQGLAQQNVETFKEFKVKKVVSTCAHCFNTLKNEYKDFGIELEVVHHTQLLNRLVREGRLTPVKDGAGAAKRSITYHDPCYIGRHNDVYTPPRELLEILPGAEFTEMERNSEKSFCCGAGGARMWMEENIGERINLNRTKEAVGTGADQIAVGCPFCRVMLSDGLTAEQAAGNAREEVEVLDVAQMLLASVKGESATKVPAMAGAGTAAAGSRAAGTPKAGSSSSDVATKAEPEAGDVTVTDDTVTDTADAGPLAKASGGSSLFDTPADEAPAKTEPAGKESAGSSLFDTPADAPASQAPAKPAPTKAEPASGGSLFDTPAPDAAGPAAADETEPSETAGAADADGTNAAAAPTEPPAAKPAAGLGSGGSLFDLEAPAQTAAAKPAPAEPAPAESAPAPAADASAEGAQDESPKEAPAAASSGGQPVGSTGSLFDIAAPDPAPGAASSAAPASPASPASTEDPPAASTTTPAAAAPADMAVDQSAAESRDEKPAEQAASSPAPAATSSGTVSSPATSIPEGGSLFDIEAPTPVSAPAAAAEPAAEAEAEAEPEPGAADAEPGADAKPGADAEPDADAEAAVEEDAPAPAAAAEPEVEPVSSSSVASGAAVSTPATSIPEGGSLFDIEAPTPAPAPAPAPATTAAAPEATAPATPDGSAPEATVSEPATSDAEASPESADDAATDDAGAPDEPTDTSTDTSTEGLSAGAALSRAATFAPEEDEESTPAEAESSEAESEAESESAVAEESDDGADQPAKTPAAQHAPRGDVHTPKTDVDINESGSLFDL